MSSHELERLRNRVSAPEPEPARTTPAEAVGVDGRDSSGLRPGDVLRIQRGAGNQAVARMLAKTNQRLIQREDIDGIDVDKTGMPSWEYADKKYHLNLLPGAFHITEEGRDEAKTVKKGRKGPTKTHYFFTTHLNAKTLKWEMKDATGSGGAPGSKSHFSLLPGALKKWVQDNWEDLTRT